MNVQIQLNVRHLFMGAAENFTGGNATQVFTLCCDT